MNEQEVMNLVKGFRPAQAIVGAARLGIFQTLGAEALAAPQVAERLALSERGARILLDALTALELLEKDGESYRNGATARRCLVPGGPSYMGTTLSHIAESMRTWMDLERAVTVGTSVKAPDDRLSVNREKNRNFIGAMAEIGRNWARIIADNVDFSGRRKLLDLGGGPGTYAMEILRRHPEMRAVIADLPLTLETSREHVQAAGFAGRIDFLPTDFFHDGALGSGYDVVLISNVLHIEGEAVNRRLLKAVRRAMTEGGLLLIHDAILEPSRTRPPERALFALHMLLSTERGNCYTFDEMADWLREAGFGRIEARDEGFAEASLMAAVAGGGDAP